MTEPTLNNEYMDTGALTEEAVPVLEDSFEEPEPTPEPYQEAPGSPSSAAVDEPALPTPDGSGPTASSLPEGAEIFADPKDAEPKPLDQSEGTNSSLPTGASVKE